MVTSRSGSKSHCIHLFSPKTVALMAIPVSSEDEVKTSPPWMKLSDGKESEYEKYLKQVDLQDLATVKILRKYPGEGGVEEVIEGTGLVETPIKAPSRCRKGPQKRRVRRKASVRRKRRVKKGRVQKKRRRVVKRKKKKGVKRRVKRRVGKRKSKKKRKASNNLF